MPDTQHEPNNNSNQETGSKEYRGGGNKFLTGSGTVELSKWCFAFLGLIGTGVLAKFGLYTAAIWTMVLAAAIGLGILYSTLRDHQKQPAAAKVICWSLFGLVLIGAIILQFYVSTVLNHATTAQNSDRNFDYHPVTTLGNNSPVTTGNNSPVTQNITTGNSDKALNSVLNLKFDDLVKTKLNSYRYGCIAFGFSNGEVEYKTYVRKPYEVTADWKHATLQISPDNLAIFTLPGFSLKGDYARVTNSRIHETFNLTNHSQRMLLPSLASVGSERINMYLEVVNPDEKTFVIGFD